MLLLRPADAPPGPFDPARALERAPPGAALRARVRPGASVLEAALASGYPIGTDCGGHGRCTRCRFLPLAAGGLPPPTAAERRQLGAGELAAGWRLACQVRVEADLAGLVPLPEDQPVRKSIDTSLPVRLEPWARRAALRLEAREGEDAGGLLGRVLEALGAGPDAGPRAGAGLASRLESCLRRARGGRLTLTLTLADGEVVDAEFGDTARRALGAVVDIGTTNLTGYLVDLWTGALLAEAFRPNAQRRWGADLMTRVLAGSPAGAGGGGALADLSGAVRRDVDALLADLLRRVRARRRHLVGLVFVGNSVMHHLFLGLAVASFGAAPYRPLVEEGVAFAPAEVGLRLPPSARARFLPLIAGFVGADAVGVALALGLDRPARARAALALDLGTNVELLLAAPGGALWCASTPAGPAFEGGEVRCGMAAAPGAICEVEVGGGLEVRTIGGLPAAGICGTGLIEAAAGLLDLGVLEPSGRMRAAGELPAGAPGAIRGRLFEREGRRAFRLVGGEGAATGEGVFLDQWDVRRLQCAKAAVRAAAELLLGEAGLAWEEVGEVFLAGAFGARLRAERARRIGLLPPVALDRVRVVGNAAGSGARLALLSRKELDRAGRIRERARYVELAGRPEFQDAFLRAMPFPDEPPGAGPLFPTPRGSSPGGTPVE